MDRRTYIAVSGASLLSLVAGCATREREPGAGSVVVQNDVDTTQEVVVDVQKVSHSASAVPEESMRSQVTPTGSSVWNDSVTLQVAAGDRFVRPDVIEEPGAYFLEITVSGMGTESMWLRFEDDVSQEGERTRYARVRIFDYGEFAINTVTLPE